MLEYFVVLVPVVLFGWIVLTVTALHKREVYFWSLGSTWTSLIGCPLALGIMSTSSLSTLHDPNAPFFKAPIVAGVILYAAAFGYATFHNFRETRSAALAVSTSMLQQFAVLGAIFLFLRWRGEEVNRGQ